MTRISALRAALALPQAAFGELIGLSQGRVSQLETGERESRSISRTLDMLAEKHGLHHLTLAAFTQAGSPGEASSACREGEGLAPSPSGSFGGAA